MASVRVNHFSSTEMTLEDLKNLQRVFESFDIEGGDGGLTERDFVKAFERILGDNLTDQQVPSVIS